jgi:hypothetical protein
MRIVSQSPTEIVVKDSTVWIGFVCAAVALALIGFGVARAQPNNFLGAALFLLFGIIGVRTTAFTFDGMQRVVRWSGYKPFKRASGMIPFDDVSDIVVEAMSGGDDSTSYRLALMTAQGNVPMAYVYTNSRDGYSALRTQILSVIKPGLAVTAPPDTAINADGIPADLDSSIRSLLKQRRKIEAITWLRSRVRIGLAEAVQRIDAIDKGQSTKT